MINKNKNRSTILIFLLNYLLLREYVIHTYMYDFTFNI